VAAVNRLDGRQYAIKKIKLSSSSINAYTKIVREVATLARLQHPNVVRYFQAWVEPASQHDSLTSEDSIDLKAIVEDASSDSTSESPSIRNRPTETITEEEPSVGSSSFLSASESSLVQVCLNLMSIASMASLRPRPTGPIFRFASIRGLDRSASICPDHRGLPTKKKSITKCSTSRWRLATERCKRLVSLSTKWRRRFDPDVPNRNGRGHKMGRAKTDLARPIVHPFPEYSPSRFEASEYFLFCVWRNQTRRFRPRQILNWRDSFAQRRSCVRSSAAHTLQALSHGAVWRLR